MFVPISGHVLKYRVVFLFKLYFKKFHFGGPVGKRFIGKYSVEKCSSFVGGRPMKKKLGFIHLVSVEGWGRTSLKMRG